MGSACCKAPKIEHEQVGKTYSNQVTRPASRQAWPIKDEVEIEITRVVRREEHNQQGFNEYHHHHHHHINSFEKQSSYQIEENEIFTSESTTQHESRNSQIGGIEENEKLYEKMDNKSHAASYHSQTMCKDAVKEEDISELNKTESNAQNFELLSELHGIAENSGQDFDVEIEIDQSELDQRPTTYEQAAITELPDEITTNERDDKPQLDIDVATKHDQTLSHLPQITNKEMVVQHQHAELADDENIPISHPKHLHGDKSMLDGLSATTQSEQYAPHTEHDMTSAPSFNDVINTSQDCATVHVAEPETVVTTRTESDDISESRDVESKRDENSSPDEGDTSSSENPDVAITSSGNDDVTPSVTIGDDVIIDSPPHRQQVENGKKLLKPKAPPLRPKTAVSENELNQKIGEAQEQEKRMMERLLAEKKMHEQTLEQRLRERRKRKEENAKRLKMDNKDSLDSTTTTVNNGGTGESSQTTEKVTLTQEHLRIVPQAPITNKEVIYAKEDISLFHALEKHAVNMHDVTSADVTFEQLMDRLLIHSLSDLEKARILFHWITYQNLNTVTWSSSIKEDSPLGYLYDIKVEQKRYATLYMRLCVAAGLHAKEISGYLKGVGYVPDYVFQDEGSDPFRGSWNAVLIDGEWRLIDTHWGSRHVVESDDASKQTKEIETVYKYEEHYFLTDPDQLINTHFPDEEAWQLLDKPLTIEQFQKLPKQWPLFYKLDLHQQSHENGVIQVDESGHLQLQLFSPQHIRQDARFRAELFTKDKRKSVDGKILESQFFHHTEGECEVFHIFLPAAGSYLLKIFGMSKKFDDSNEDDAFTNLCLFQLNCPRIASNQSASSKPLLAPPFSRTTQYYGVSLSAYDINLVSFTPPSGIVECDAEGKASVTVSVRYDDCIEFSQAFQSAVGDYRLDERCVQWSETKDNILTVTFNIRAPSNGNYVLTLFESHVRDSPSLKSFAAFLVVSRLIVDGAAAPSFPPTVNGKLGPVRRVMDDLAMGLERLHPEQDASTGMCVTDKKGEIVFLFKHSHSVTLMADCDEKNASVLVTNTPEHTAIAVRAKHHGQFALKLYAASPGKSKNLPLALCTLIEVPFLPSILPPYPKSPTNAWGPMLNNMNMRGITVHKIEHCSSFIRTRFNVDLPGFDPTVVYKGGKDIKINFNYNKPVHVKAIMQRMDAESKVDDFGFVSSANETSCTVMMRFPTPGIYSMSVYVAEVGQTNYSLIYNFLCFAHAPSNCLEPYPMVYGPWNSSVRQLRHVLKHSLERNQEHRIKLSLARYAKDGSGVECFPHVLLMNDKNQVVPITNQKGFKYEWVYLPGPGEHEIMVAVKQEAGSSSLALVLKYVVV